MVTAHLGLGLSKPSRGFGTLTRPTLGLQQTHPPRSDETKDAFCPSVRRLRMDGPTVGAVDFSSG